jgi:hypothetical protein
MVFYYPLISFCGLEMRLDYQVQIINWENSVRSLTVVIWTIQRGNQTTAYSKQTQIP